MKPPVDLSSPYTENTLDNLQHVMQRKAELAKHKAKYALTEKDGELLVTHAIELHFGDGQVIVEAGHDISNVYRVKYGHIKIFRHGNECCELKQGYFIGDPLLLYDDKPTYRMNVTMVAQGPVELLQLDLNFIRRLFALDIPMAMKFYRLIAAKSSSIFHQLVNNLHTSVVCASFLDNLNESMTSDTSSDASFEVHSAPCFEVNSAPPPSAVSTVDLGASRTVKRRSKRLSRSLLNDAYKVYPLISSRHGVQMIRVKAKKLKIVTKSFGLTHKTSIEFARLNSITKISENAIMITHQERKFNTVYFKHFHDLEEFLYLVSNLATPAPVAPQVSTQPVTTPPANVELTVEEDQQMSKGEEHFRNVQRSIELKKGDVLCEEGDLYQRVYTITSGTLAVYQKGVFIHYLTEGQVFGVDTMIFLRPSPVRIEVHSDTATMLIVTAYMITQLIDSDIAIAQKLFKRAAQIIDAQIGKIFQLEQKFSVAQARRSQPFLGIVGGDGTM